MARKKSTLIGFVFLLGFVATGAAQSTYLNGLNQVSTVASTVPANGDVNPYGVYEVPASSGNLVAGHILVSNFNNSSNLQGTGTTIMDISPQGAVTQFAQISAASLPGSCPGGVGLTTALVVLKSGWVIVGSLPTADGTSATAKAGCLIVLNNMGQVVETFAGGAINGPWDMTVYEHGDDAILFVTNVLNGTIAAAGRTVYRGTVARLHLETSTTMKPRLTGSTVVGSAFPERTDAAALVIGPTGVAFDSSTGVLYVADSLANRIAAIPFALTRNETAGRGITISRGGALNDPLGLILAPNRDLVAANGNDGNVVEVTRFGHQVATKELDGTGNPPGAGTLFGLSALSNGLYFVDDGSNTLNILR